MDKINEIIDKYGATWSAQMAEDLVQVYEPLQRATNARYVSSINVTKGIKYGPDDHQRVDIYRTSPPEDDVGVRPVVVFFHGGAFVKGDNDWAPGASFFGNIGYHFARNGCVVILATYRLVFQSASHPSGPEDIAGALHWAQTHAAKYGGDPKNVVAIGHSAGGAWLASALFTGLLDGGLIRGVALLSTPLTLNLDNPMRLVPMRKYFGTDSVEVIRRHLPTKLFRENFLDEDGKGLPAKLTPAQGRKRLPCDVLVLVSEHDSHDDVVKGTLEWTQDYLLGFGKMPVIEVVRGHNHMSIVLSVGLEVPGHKHVDEVGSKLLGFVRDCTRSTR